MLSDEVDRFFARTRLAHEPEPGVHRIDRTGRASSHRQVIDNEDADTPVTAVVAAEYESSSGHLASSPVSWSL